MSRLRGPGCALQAAWALLLTVLMGGMWLAVAVAAISLSGCTVRYTGGKGWEHVRNVWEFTEVRQSPGERCYTTAHGIIVRAERGVECPSEVAVTHETKAVIDEFGYDSDVFVELGVTFLQTPLQCRNRNNERFWANGCATENFAVVMLRNDWRRIYRHELTHVALTRTRQLWDYDHVDPAWVRLEQMR